MLKPHYKILFVEDEPAHARLVERAFENTSDRYRLSVVNSLTQARQLVATSPPDLILADFLLPDGRGTELIPTDHETASYPVVILTSHGNEDIAVDAMKSGALDYVVKSDVILSDMPHIAERALREWQHMLDVKQAEKDRERFVSILQATTDMVCMMDHHRRLLYLNSSGRELLGIGPAEEISHSSLSECMPEWAYEIVEQKGIPAAIEQGSWSGITALVSRDGKEIPVSQVLLCHKDHQRNVEFFSTICRDITEQKRAEEEERSRAVAQAQISQLSPREKQVLDLVVTGKPNKMIAVHLDLSEKTIEKHRSSLMKKLRVRSVAELVRIALSANH